MINRIEAGNKELSHKAEWWSRVEVFPTLTMCTSRGLDKFLVNYLGHIHKAHVRIVKVSSHHLAPWNLQHTQEKNPPIIKATISGFNSSMYQGTGKHVNNKKNPFNNAFCIVKCRLLLHRNVGKLQIENKPKQTLVQLAKSSFKEVNLRKHLD